MWASVSTCRGSKGRLSPKAATRVYRLRATSAWPGALKVQAGSGGDGVEGNMGFLFPLDRGGADPAHLYTIS
jgi:hypothetical protein